MCICLIDIYVNAGQFLKNNFHERTFFEKFSVFFYLGQIFPDDFFGIEKFGFPENIDFSVKSSLFPEKI